MSYREDFETNSNKNLNRKQRFEKLCTPKIRIDNKRLNAFQVRPAALTYEISESINKLAQPKQKHSSNNYKYSSPSFLLTTPTLKPENLVKKSSTTKNSTIENSENGASNMETYAKIAARRKSIYLKRLHDFPRPMKKSAESGFESLKTENKFSQIMKNYNSGKRR